MNYRDQAEELIQNYINSESNDERFSYVEMADDLAIVEALIELIVEARGGQVPDLTGDVA